MSKFYVYILYSSSRNRYYIGSCQDLEDRLNRHNSGYSKSTKSGIPWTLKYKEEFSSRSEAVRREMEIKKMKSRKYIENLIQDIDIHYKG